MAEARRGRGRSLVKGLPREGLDEKQFELMTWAIGLHVGVGRPLGTQAARVFAALDPGCRAISSPQDMGAIVAAACLMHDIGNPPFGHAGEAAIQEYFHGPGRAWVQDLAPAEQADLLHFEGNAQGFRTVARLQHPEQPGGLQLTWPTLGAFAKYPCDAVSGLQPGAAVSRRKFGFMQGERPLFAEVAEGLGLQRTGASAWQRHPLAFLVEAADDICYGVIDIEDGAKSDHITPEELRALHMPFIDAAHRARADTLQDRQHQAEYLRAVTIGVLVDLNGGTQQHAKDVALHVAAERPQYLTRDEVEAGDIEKEREILTNKALAEGKPQQIVEKIVEGQIGKCYQE